MTIFNLVVIGNSLEIRFCVKLPINKSKSGEPGMESTRKQSLDTSSVYQMWPGRQTVNS